MHACPRFGSGRSRKTHFCETFELQICILDLGLKSTFLNDLKTQTKNYKEILIGGTIKSKTETAKYSVEGNTLIQTSVLS